MAFNLKSILNPAPPSGSTTPLPPTESLDDEMTEQIVEQDEGGERAGKAADKLAGLTLNTNTIDGGQTLGTTASSESKRPTSSSSQSPINTKSSPNSATAYPYAAPLTNLSYEAPALQSFVPAQVDRNKIRVPSSGSAGGSSISPPPEANVIVKEEEDERSPIIKSKEDIKEFDPATQAKVQALRNEHGLRGSIGRSKSESETPSVGPEIKKRPPKKAPVKKGMAKKAGGPKKRKSLDATSAIKKNAVKKVDSDVPDEDEDMQNFDESEADDDMEDGDGEDEEEVYCICRKPDDHKYMIACDGGCGDWFHGACVKISEEQGQLIDKFICINCSEAAGGMLATTWRPICRYPGCVAAARVENTVVRSLYCSDDHGRAFWQSVIRDQKYGTPGKNATKVKKSAKLIRESTKLGYHRGGSLPPTILKALLANITTASSFHSLGESVPLPNHIEMPDISGLESVDPKTSGLSPEDVTELDGISKTRTSLVSRRTAAQNRSKLLSYAISRRDRTIAKLGIKRSAWCGYDADLVLPPTELAARIEVLDQNEVKKEDVEEVIPDSVCQRKNCSVHGKWADTEKQDSWMEIRMWTQRIEELERRVEEIGEAAARRGRSSLLVS